MPLGRVAAFRLPPLAGDGFPPVEVRVEYRLEVPVPGRRQAGQRMRACGLKPFLAVLLGKVEHGERRVVRLLLDLHAAEDAVDDGRAVRPDFLGPALMRASSHSGFRNASGMWAGSVEYAFPT